MLSRIAFCLAAVVGLTISVGAQDMPGGAARSATIQPGAELPTSEALRLAKEKKDLAVERRDSNLLREALDLLRPVLEREPFNIEARLVTGELLMETNDYNSARDHFKAALDIEPSNFRANLAYGRIMNANKSYRQAAELLEKAERVAGEAKRMVEVKRALAVAYSGMGKLSAGIDKSSEAVKADPNDLDGLQTSVEIRLSAASKDARYLEGREGALVAADHYVDKARESLQQKPYDRERLNRLIRAYELLLSVLRTHHNSYYERDLRNQPTDKLMRGKEVEAAGVLNRLAQEVSEQAVLRMILADHDSVMLAEKAVEYDPRNVKYLETLAALYQRVSNRDRAVEVCRQIIERDPGNVGAQQYLESMGEPLSAPPESPATQPAPAEDTSS